MSRALLIAGLLLAAGLFRAESALACATCACADPTLTTMGVAKPTRGRLRAAVGFMHRSSTIGTPGWDEMAVAEQRLEASLAWTPAERVQLALTLPFVRRRVDYVSGARDTATSVGDVELLGRFYFYQDRRFAARHAWAVEAGLELPTAPRLERADGSSLPIEAQTGSGSFDPSVGLVYGFFTERWSAYTRVRLLVPTEGFGARQGPAAVVSGHGQYQPVGWLGLRLGADARASAIAYEGGALDLTSGGFIAYVRPEVVVMPATDAIVRLALHWPVVDALRGAHDEGPMVTAGVVYDL